MRRFRVAELPYSFFGGQQRNEESRRLMQQLQANNDHIMSVFRAVAKRLTDLDEQVDRLTTLIESRPADER